MHDKDQTEHFLGDYLFSQSLTQLLIVGDLPQVLVNHPAQGVSVRQLASLEEAEQHVMHTQSDNELSDQATRALVLQFNPDDAQFEQCLGRAIRAFPHRVLLHCTTTRADPGRGDDAFFAFGFRKLAIEQDESPSGRTVKWFEYRLSQYKPAPDWLNAQFWANPERFDVDGDLDDYYDESEDDEEE